MFFPVPEILPFDRYLVLQKQIRKKQWQKTNTRESKMNQASFYKTTPASYTDHDKLQKEYLQSA